MLTGEYYSNLRNMEMVFAAAGVVLLSSHSELFASALYGQLISLLGIGFALFPYGDRLGAAQLEDRLIGNPIAFGVPLAMLLVLANADDGRWLLAVVQNGDGGEFEHHLRDPAGKWTRLTLFAYQYGVAAFGTRARQRLRTV